MIRLLASYNSGPGNFQRWGAAIRDDGDPLMFIEAIPVAETRAFVPAGARRILDLCGAHARADAHAGQPGRWRISRGSARRPNRRS